MTLPEALVKAIGELVRAQDEFKRQIEEMQACADQIQVQIDRLVARKEKLETIIPGSNKPVGLPRAIQPVQRSEPDSAA